MSTTAITQSNFKALVQGPGIVIVDFWAPWCGPCRAFAPIFEAASKRHPGVTWGKVNTEEEPALAGALRIQAIPTLMAFRDGVLLFEQAGMVPPAALDRLVEQLGQVDMADVRRRLRSQQGGQSEASRP